MAIVSQKANGAITLAEANRQMAYVSTPNYYSNSGYVGGYNGGVSWDYSVPAGSTSISTPNNYGAIDNIQTITGQSEALVPPRHVEEDRRRHARPAPEAGQEVQRRVLGALLACL